MLSVTSLERSAMFAIQHFVYRLVQMVGSAAYMLFYSIRVKLVTSFTLTVKLKVIMLFFLMFIAKPEY